MAELATKGHEPTASITNTGQARFAEYQDPYGNLVHILQRND